MKIYGVKHNFQIKEVQERRRKTWLEKYNVNNPMKNPEIRKKQINTLFKNHGVTNPMFSEEIVNKRKRDFFEKYGVETSFESEIFRNKAKQTLLKKYGVENPMQCEEIFERSKNSAFKRKNYTLPSGKIIKIQGYEGFCLDELILIGGILEEEIFSYFIIKHDNIKDVKMPEIWYYFNEKDRRYYPDFYIPSENCIIEVKSQYTFEKDKEKNFAKAAACVELGYNYQIRIYNKKGELIETIEFDENNKDLID